MSNIENKNLAAELYLQRIETQVQNLMKMMPMMNELAKGSTELQEYVSDQLAKYALSVSSSKLNKDKLKGFFNRPYYLYKDRKDKENEWHLAIPSFIDVQFGWLEKVEEGFNIFFINRYVDWLTELPEALKKQIGATDPLEVFLDNDMLVGKDVHKIKEKYKKFIKSEDAHGRLIIDKSQHFELLATMIKDNIKPFVPRPIDKDLLVDRRSDVVLRDYQEEAWNFLKQFSNIGVFWPPSGGKTFLGIHVCTHIKGPHLIAVPSTLLREQWIARLELYTDLVAGQDYDVMTYQGAIKYGHKKPYTTLILDEVHHLPANEFSKLHNIPRKITLGLSATPQREDGRENFIFALTGYSVGLSWDHFKRHGIIQTPPMHVWIVKNDAERMKRLEVLVADKKKTIIFSDSIDQGASIAKRYGIPHVHGGSKEKLETIKNSQMSVVSRVGDEGVSLPDIERVIETSWLFGSRRQELQRFTRLLHGKDTGKDGHIIMTAVEYDRDHKRLFSIMDHGFKIVLHREGVSDKVVDGSRSVTPEPARQKRLRPSRIRTSKLAQEVVKPNDFELNHPLLSLPGIQKKLDLLRKNERMTIRLLYERPAQVMTSTEIGNFIGVLDTSMRGAVNFGKLIDMKLIKKVDKGYQAM